MLANWVHATVDREVVGSSLWTPALGHAKPGTRAEGAAWP